MGGGPFFSFVIIRQMICTGGYLTLRVLVWFMKEGREQKSRLCTLGLGRDFLLHYSKGNDHVSA